MEEQRSPWALPTMRLQRQRLSEPYMPTLGLWVVDVGIQSHFIDPAWEKYTAEPRDQRRRRKPCMIWNARNQTRVAGLASQKYLPWPCRSWLSRCCAVALQGPNAACDGTPATIYCGHDSLRPRNSNTENTNHYIAVPIWAVEVLLKGVRE